jgi:hypothetical protein
MKAQLTILLTALLLLTTQASAQDGPSEGTRVRIRQKDHPLRIGTLRSLSADSVSWLDSSGTQYVLARQNLELERSLGKRPRFWKHLGITMLGGAVAGGLISAMTWSECESTEFLGCLLVPESRGEAAGYGVLAGAAIGLPIGAIIGAAVKVERWEPVPW